MDYRCKAGHEQTTPEPKRLDFCLSAICLDPRLEAYGEGSREENARLKELYEREDDALGTLDL